MEWPTALVLIVLIVSAASVRAFRDWLHRDRGDETTEAVGFMQFDDDD